MKSKLYTGAVLLILGLFLLAGAAVLSFSNMNEERQAGKKSEETVGLIIGQITWTDDKKAEQEETSIDIDGSKYIGILTVPKLSLELPVADQLSMKELKKTPCRYSGSAKDDDLVIAAHNYQTHFGAIYTLAADDEIYFTEIDGTVNRYSVAEVEVLKPYETERMMESEYDLTLFTCTVGGRSRVTVRCERKSRNSD